MLGAFARELLAPMDNLERALAAGEKSPDKALLEGLKLTYQMLIGVFSKAGLKPMETLGQPFDPNEHEALMMAQDPALENNVVAQVFEKGWKLHERVLRPAKVVVNKKS
jgi:molecular chaperone GrpE